MSSDRFLVTGALGCIGAWVLKRLVDEGTPAWSYDRPGASLHRARLVMTDEALARVQFIDGDIRDGDVLESALVEHGITHVINLAGLQVPFVKADPVLGALVNVAGTTVAFEAVRHHKTQVAGLVYASSAAVWGAPSAYPPGPVAEGAAPKPTTLYGVYKLANEGTARIYWQDYGVASIGLRPNVVWGPGRDQGLTSPPSKALLAAALGRPYHIAWGGKTGLQYASDVADIFIRAARACREGGECYDLGGPVIGMDEFVSLVEKEAPEARGGISYEAGEWPQVELSGRRLERMLGSIEWTSLEDAMRESLSIFRGGAVRGVLDVDSILENAPGPAAAIGGEARS